MSKKLEILEKTGNFVEKLDISEENTKILQKNWKYPKCVNEIFKWGR